MKHNSGERESMKVNTRLKEKRDFMYIITAATAKAAAAAKVETATAVTTNKRSLETDIEIMNKYRFSYIPFHTNPS